MLELDTRLTRRLDLAVPIVQAPIGSATCPALAAAVADAGGLGMLAITWRGEDATREVVAATLDRIGGTAGDAAGAVGVNIVLDPGAKDVPTETHVDAALDAGVEIISLSFGDVEELPLYAGQSAGLTDEVQSAAALVDDLAAETTAALEQVGE